MKNLALLILIYSSFTFAVFPKGGAKTLYIEGVDYHKMNWRYLARTEKESLKEIVRMLRDSETGGKLLVKAQSVAAQQGLTLYDVIIPGEGSLTDTTLIRKFSASNPQHVVYESRSKVYLNRDLSVIDAVLDLAHELTHFSFRAPFNPYVGTFDLPGFVESTIDGKGGEVDAYIVECRVYDEIFKGKFGYKENCQRVKDGVGKLSKKIASNLFYRSGHFHGRIHNHLKKYDHKKKKPPVSNKQAVFISSAYGVPYALAAIKEYETIMGKACENDKRRMVYLRQSAARRPASEPNSNHNLLERFERGFIGRCQNFD